MAHQSCKSGIKILFYGRKKIVPWWRGAVVIAAACREVDPGSYPTRVKESRKSIAMLWKKMKYVGKTRNKQENRLSIEVSTNTKCS
jgi:hypothetical protein